VRPFHLLGVDPGLCHLGLAVLRVGPGGCSFVATAVCETDKDERKTTRAAHGNTVRSRELRQWYVRQIEQWKPLAVCAEELCQVRNSSAWGKICLSWGVVIGCTGDLPIVEVSPKDRIKRITGLRSATKMQVRDAMARRHPELASMWPTGPRGGEALIEHAADAASAVLACLDEDAVRAVIAARR
jgi:Holliday junction resolvasome RuvABC endonuclease subunit